MLVRHLCDIRRHRLEPLMLEFGSGADNATRRGRDWRLFGACRFENQATRSGITYNALAPESLVMLGFHRQLIIARYQVSGPFVDLRSKGSGDVSSLYTVEI